MNTDSTELRSAHRKATRRLVPILVLLLFINYLDRVNVGFAAPTMNPALGMTTTGYGLGVALFFVGYVLLEVPSNYVLYRVGARRWLARIALTWGVVAALHAAVSGTGTFVVARVLLGIAEAGLLPGILWYISQWFSGRRRVFVLGAYYVAVPLSTAIGGPLSNWLIHHGQQTFGVEGWRFMFAVEGIAAVVLGFVVLFLLTDTPAAARWLTPGERQALIEANQSGREDGGRHSFLSALRSATTIRLAIVFLLLTFPMFAITFFVPLVATGLVADHSGTAVDVVTFIPFALGAIASAAWSRMARRTLRGRHLALPALLAGVGVALCAFAGTSFPLLVAGVACSAIGIYAAIPVFWSITSAGLDGAAAASGLALINTVGAIGGFIAGYATGWLRELSGGYQLPFGVMALALVLCGLLSFTIPRSNTAEVASSGTKQVSQ
ncbi:MFS transporter [Saccharopolyspora phatthalungensis]|uniref:MFS family permease n=1 Tax=Saccharopolyspora phatthalungensis TaxID=664693 RepID=A0A840Q9J3_9PSEU|nr:MFS transporter [Saccharopolyspora phatthalungensis]MBB5157106.1 MFS family permease [Saccharopolyspora phatthalungensis]